MVPSCKYFRNPMSWLLALVLTMTWAFSFTEGVAITRVRGELGGNVTIRCPGDNRAEIKLFYFQKGTEFVNGFYRSKNITKPWENTRVEKYETVVHMYRLNFSHGGDYECHIQEVDKNLSTFPVQLYITANYSKPTVTSACPDEFGCTVTCTSHGGYPSTRMMWDVPVSGNTSSEMWKVVNSSEERSPGTMVFTSSSTAYFNCSKGEIKIIGCSVAGIPSDRFSVCTQQKPPSNPYVIAATALCAIIVLIIVIMVLRWHCRRKTRETEAASWNLNVYREEVIVLNSGVTKEAS
ncbi:uncharacterized protein [Channa argus]|nr:hypothetical protein Q8A73_006721 [Channa argus]